MSKITPIVGIVLLGVLAAGLWWTRRPVEPRLYFVSYSWYSDELGKSGNGNAELSVSVPIEDMDDVRNMSKVVAGLLIQRTTPIPDANIVILNWREFER